jgi:hypothetical protein
MGLEIGFNHANRLAYGPPADGPKRDEGEGMESGTAIAARQRDTIDEIETGILNALAHVEDAIAEIQMSRYGDMTQPAVASLLAARRELRNLGVEDDNC